MTPPNLLILWDVDGTLINLPTKSSNLHLEIVEEYTNKKLREPNSNLGKTDLGLIKEIYELNKMQFNSRDLKLCIELLNLKSKSESYKLTRIVNPGVEKALNYARKVGATNSVLTGNSKFRVLKKISHTGLIPKLNLDLGFFGDLHYSREELVKSAKNAKGKQHVQKIILVGDTRLDVEAAQKNSLPIISVASGHETYSELKRLNPNFSIKDFNTDFNLFTKILCDFL